MRTYIDPASKVRHDQETATHYNYFRDYDPAIGRYIQSDPIGLEGGLNSFAYAYDNPLIFYDAEGTVAAQTVVLCTAAALTAYGAYKLYGKYSCQRDCQVDCQIKHSCKDAQCSLGEGNTGPLNACRRECVASCWLGMGKKGPMGPTPKSFPNNPSPLPRS